MPKRPTVFIDIQIGPRVGGRVVFELFDDICPKTSENFRGLCTGSYGIGKSGKKLSYKGSKIFRIKPGFIMQGGDITKNTGDGGDSIYGGAFRDENFDRRHNVAGVLSMANKGRNTNTSQFFVTLKGAPMLDGKHTAFGHVVQGMEIIRAVEKVPVDRQDRPRVPVTIVNCGELQAGEGVKIDHVVQMRHDLGELFTPTDNSRKSTTKFNAANEAQNILVGQKNLIPAEAEEPGEPGEEGQPESDAEDDAQPAPAIFKNEREKRLFMLRQKMNQGRVANTKAVLDEKERLTDPVAWDKKRRAEEYHKKKEKEVEAADADPQGLRKVTTEGREYLTDTVERVEMYDAKRRKKEDMEADGSDFGWNVFNQSALYAAHDKRIKELKHDAEEYQAQKAELGARMYHGAQDVQVNHHVPSLDAKERLAEALENMAKKKQAYSRRRAYNPDQDVDFINERNRHFNKKMERAYGTFSAEVKANFERGTAL